MKKNIASLKLFIISISIVIFFCVIGIGYSKWNGGIELTSLLSTGSMDVVFDSCEISEKKNQSPEIPADAKAFDPQISPRGKNIYVVIEDACPGYSATIKYSITNKGDIPVYCKLITGAEDVDIIVIDKPTEVLEANGGSCAGKIEIRIPDNTTDNTTENTNYNLVLSLDYVQYNEIR